MGGVTGDVTGLELAKVCQQSHVSVMGHNIKRNNKIFTVHLKDVKHTPTAPNNLISIGRLTDHNYHANFT